VLSSTRPPSIAIDPPSTVPRLRALTGHRSDRGGITTALAAAIGETVIWSLSLSAMVPPLGGLSLEKIEIELNQGVAGPTGD
jgi:hypothetical protein